MRIVLIHATPLAIAPVQQAFERHWPDAEIMNLLDDRLSVDRAAAGLSERITARIAALADYGIAAGADGILYTCSAFGPAIEAVAHRASIPVLKPNEAMFAEVLEAGGPVGLVASFAPSLAPMAAEFTELAEAKGCAAMLDTACAAEAMTALADGDGERHDQLLAEVAATLSEARVLMLAQFSTARAADAVAAVTGKPVFTSPDSAVRTLRHRLLGT
ncbi:MAG: aspartate/glutamate racemase family protein [Pseudomonadota bacterium]